jgi:hypothetical protein
MQRPSRSRRTFGSQISALAISLLRHPARLASDGLRVAPGCRYASRVIGAFAAIGSGSHSTFSCIMDHRPFELGHSTKDLEREQALRAHSVDRIAQAAEESATGPDAREGLGQDRAVAIAARGVFLEHLGAPSRPELVKLTIGDLVLGRDPGITIRTMAPPSSSPAGRQIVYRMVADYECRSICGTQAPRHLPW